MPFKTTAGFEVGWIDLRQVGANKFTVLREFGWEPPDGGPALKVEVGAETDLASVPSWLWWFVASHGRHTRAAVLHDTLVVDHMTYDARADADKVFLQALRDCEVGWWRRHIMWSAVTYATLKNCRPWLLTLMAVQIVLGVLAVAWWSWDPVLGVPGPAWLVLPAVASCAWRRLAPAVALGTYLGPLIAPASITVLGTIGLTSVPRLLRWLWGRIPRTESPIVKPTSLEL